MVLDSTGELLAFKNETNNEKAPNDDRTKPAIEANLT